MKWMNYLPEIVYVTNFKYIFNCQAVGYEKFEILGPLPGPYGLSPTALGLPGAQVGLKVTRD